MKNANKIKCMTAHWERDGKPSAPRVEHRYYVGDRIMIKTGGAGGKNFKIKSVLYFLFRIEEKSKNL